MKIKTGHPEFYFYCKLRWLFGFSVALLPGFIDILDLFMLVHLRFVVFLLAITALVAPLYGQENFNVGEDLQTGWMVFDKGDYRSFLPHRDAGSRTIYFWVDAARHEGKSLLVNGRYKKALFINGKVYTTSQNRIKLDLDELRLSFHSSMLLVCIYQENINSGNLETKVVSDTVVLPSLPNVDIPKAETYFRDFVIIGTISLLVLLVAITQLAKLSLRYFSIKRLFSYESDDTQLYTRIISGSNILFYIFCSLVLSFYLVIIFHHIPDQFIMAWTFRTASFAEALTVWVQLSAILLIFFLLRIMLVFIVSRMFNLREFFGFQIINWVRMLLIVFGLSSVFLIVYSVGRGINSDTYRAFYGLIFIVLITWSIVLFMKVTRRAGFSLFHIFSYLCVTEIIPLLITVKFLFQ